MELNLSGVLKITFYIDNKSPWSFLKAVHDLGPGWYRIYFYCDTRAWLKVRVHNSHSIWDGVTPTVCQNDNPSRAPHILHSFVSGDPQEECRNCGKMYLTNGSSSGNCPSCRKQTPHGDSAEDSSGNHTEDSNGTTPEWNRPKPALLSFSLLLHSYVSVS